MTNGHLMSKDTPPNPKKDNYLLYSYIASLSDPLTESDGEALVLEIAEYTFICHYSQVHSD